MIGAARRWLRSIDYHSARRERTTWTRLFDRAFFLAPILAAALAAWLHATVSSRIPVPGLKGGIDRIAGRSAVLIFEEGASPTWSAAPVGEFEVRRTVTAQGWPFASGIRRQPAVLAARWFLPNRLATPLDDPDLRRMIDGTIEREAPAPVREELRLARPTEEPRLLGFAANFAVLWIALLVALALLIQFLRLGAWFVGGLRSGATARRVRAGRCPHCGYDVRGSLFSERCPECGGVLE